MVGTQSFVIIIATCFCLTWLTVVDANSSTRSRLSSRTWDEAIAMAKSFVQQLNLTEKCAMTSGVKGPCAGNVLSIPRLNFNGMCFQDSPSGVGDGVLQATAFVPGIQIAATWDRDLFYKRAVAIGKEFSRERNPFCFGSNDEY